jgi:hypothetical protein
MEVGETLIDAEFPKLTHAAWQSYAGTRLYYPGAMNRDIA